MGHNSKQNRLSLVGYDLIGDRSCLFKHLSVRDAPPQKEEPVMKQFDMKSDGSLSRKLR